MGFSAVEETKMEKKAHRIHEKCLTIDTHCDTPMKMIKPGFNVRDEHTVPKSRVDLPRMKKGGLDAIFFAVFTGQKPRTLPKDISVSSPDARLHSLDAET